MVPSLSRHCDTATGHGVGPRSTKKTRRVAVSQCPETEGILDMARGNVPVTCVAFKRLLRCSDDRSLPLVEKICDSMGFRAARSGPPGVFLYYEESDRGQTITAKKTTKSLISNQKTQEYIKSKCPLFIL